MIPKHYISTSTFRRFHTLILVICEVGIPFCRFLERNVELLLPETFDDIAENVDFTTDSSVAKTKSVVAWTTHGSVKGQLLDTPVSMRLDNSNSYERAYKFTYADFGEIETGNCGTFVTNPEEKVLHGHIIAKTEHLRV